MNARSRLPMRFTALLRLAPAVFSTVLIGCTSKLTWKPGSSPDHEGRLANGCIFYMDGAGGGTAKTNYAAGVVSGMLDAGYQGAAEIVSWETGKGLLADQKASVAYKRARARQAAEKIQEYIQTHRGAPVGILGFSAGSAEAVFALEALPESVQIDQVVLLGASISRDYDMTQALKRVKKLYVITSTHDRMLSTLMPLSGTADRKYHDPGAGIKGFVIPKDASYETHQLYAERIVTIPYSKDFRKDQDEGHHFDNVKEAFIRDHVAPLLMAQVDEQTASGPALEKASPALE